MKGFVNEEDYFEIGAGDRLTLWNSVSGELKQTKNDKKHQSGVYSCCCYGLKGASPASVIVVVGNKKGELSIWDFTKGKQLKACFALPGVTSSDEISDVCMSADTSKIYTCSKNSKYVYEIDSEKGTVLRKIKASKHGVVKICVNEAGTQLLTAGSEISLWDLETGLVLRTFAGHESPVGGLQFSPDGKHFISFCEDRFIHLWSTTGETLDETTPKKQRKKKKKRKSKDNLTPTKEGSSYERAPLRIFAAKSPVIWAMFSGGVLGCVGEDESGSLWKIDKLHQPQQEKYTNPDCVILPYSQEEDSVSAGGLICFNFPQHASLKQLVVVRYTPLRPVFETIDLCDDVDEWKERVVLDDLEEESRLVKVKDASNIVVKDRKTEMLEREDDDKMDEEKTGLTFEKKQDNQVHIAKATTASSTTVKDILGDQKDEMEEDEEEDDTTMGERVVALTEKLTKSIETNSRKRPREERDMEGPAATAGSLSTVLDQSLQSNDDQLFEVCLRNNDPAIVSATVQRLSPARVGPFLKKIIRKFESKPARAELLLVWIRALLEHHSSHIAKENVNSLRNLHQMTESRVSLYPKFLRLSGRLEFISARVTVRKNKVSKPAVVYDEEVPVNDDDIEMDD